MIKDGVIKWEGKVFRPANTIFPCQGEFNLKHIVYLDPQFHHFSFFRVNLILTNILFRSPVSKLTGKENLRYINTGREKVNQSR